MEGYIKLHRKILDNGIFRKPKVSHLFNYCLLRANWSDKTIVWNSQPLVVERGSFITGRKQIAQDTGLSEQNVRYALRTLHTFGMVKPSNEKSTSKFTYLTVCNYDDYQHLEDEANQQSNQQVTSNQPTSNQQVTTNKNNKTNNTKNTNKKKDIAYGYSDVFEKWWSVWLSKKWRGTGGVKSNAHKHWKGQCAKLTPEQIQTAMENYMVACSKANSYHKDAEGFLNPANGLVQQYLDYIAPVKVQHMEQERTLPDVKDYTNVRRQVKLGLSQMSKEQTAEYWEEIPKSWKQDDKIQQLFKEKLQ
eukprot:GHVR01162222.1.p1 GENE.GHVR01162222.1~~GHVR01162222.1.p1  ORF type:complete len:304 (+),score=19.24 GHVR01162222.1:270-1181(+)